MPMQRPNEPSTKIKTCSIAIAERIDQYIESGTHLTKGEVLQALEWLRFLLTENWLNEKFIRKAPENG